MKFMVFLSMLVSSFAWAASNNCVGKLTQKPYCVSEEKALAYCAENEKNIPALEKTKECFDQRSAGKKIKKGTPCASIMKTLKPRWNKDKSCGFKAVKNGTGDSGENKKSTKPKDRPGTNDPIGEQVGGGTDGGGETGENGNGGNGGGETGENGNGGNGGGETGENGGDGDDNGGEDNGEDGGHGEPEKEKEKHKEKHHGEEKSTGSK